MRALMSFTYNCGTNNSGSDWSQSTEILAPVLLTVSFLMELDLIPVVIY